MNTAITIPTTVAIIAASNAQRTGSADASPEGVAVMFLLTIFTMLGLLIWAMRD